MTANPLPGPVVWLTGEYPRATDTFIQREVAALRSLGFDLRTVSVRRTRPEHHVGPEQRAEAARTLVLLERAARLGALLDHGRAIRRAPGAWARGLATAWRRAAPGVRGRLYGLIYFHEAVVLAGALRAMGAVHLHCHIAMAASSVARLAAPLAGIPWSFTLHGPDDLMEPRRWDLSGKVAEARFVACISAFARSQAMLHAAPADWGRLHVVHCGVEPARYAREGARDPDRLLFVGRLAAVKGVPVLLRALALARGARPGLRLTLVGDGPERAAIEAEAARLGLAGAVEVLGYRSQEEVAGLLAACGALVLPSFAEGVPVVLMEAMAAGLPVVATRIAGVPELVEEGVSGLLVPPGEEEALARAILAATGDPARAARMGEAGRARVRAEFDSRIEAERLGRLLVWAATGGDPPARRPEPLR